MKDFAKLVVSLIVGYVIGTVLVFMCGCAGMRPTQAPITPAHWSSVHQDYVHGWVTAVAVNSSTDPVVLDCSDMRVTIPPRTEVDVMIPAGNSCDLTNEETLPRKDNE